MVMGNLLWWRFGMIKLIPTLETGWKKQERRRFGEVYVIRFVDEANKILFRWCPTCEDFKQMKYLLDLADRYDLAVSTIKRIKQEQEGKVHE